MMENSERITIEEAIERNRKESEYLEMQQKSSKVKLNNKLIQYHKDMADWLEELIEARETLSRIEQEQCEEEWDKYFCDTRL